MPHEPAQPEGTVLFRLAPVRPWMWLALSVLFAVAVALDGWVIDSMPAARVRLGDHQRLFRVAGYLPTWVLVGTILACTAAGTPRFRQRVTEAVAIVLTSAMAGGLAAVLKIVIRRPDIARWEDGTGFPAYDGWRFAPLGEQPWDGTNLCCPSEHCAISFGAVVMLSRLYPGASVPLLLIGVGTAAMRVRQRGHHPSDTVVSLAVALTAAILVPALMAALSRTRLGPRLGLSRIEARPARLRPNGPRPDRVLGS